MRFLGVVLCDTIRSVSYMLTSLMIVSSVSVIVLTSCHTSGERHNTVPESLSALYAKLGRPEPAHAIGRYSPELVQQGKALIHTGRAFRNGDSTERISSYFVCTDCHSTVNEVMPVSSKDPAERLQYLQKHELPLLPGSPLKGVVNRVSWYNGFYQEKYGEAAKAAQYDLNAAIQLCARECSKGRRLEAWEMEAILHYLWSIEYQLEELDLSIEQQQAIQQGLKRSLTEEEKKIFLAVLDASYLRKAGATEVPIPEDPAAGYGIAGNPEQGEYIYKASCLYCHSPGRVARFDLDTSSRSFARLAAKIPKTSRASFYHAVREGYEGTDRNPQYMPLFTAERLSNRQIEDLRAYIESKVHKEER